MVTIDTPVKKVFHSNLLVHNYIVDTEKCILWKCYSR